MTDDSCKPSRSAGSVPRACTPFSPPPPTSSVPVVAPPVFVPVAPVMPVMTVSGEAPDRFGNVDIRPFVRTVLGQALLDLDLLAPFLARIVESGTFAPASHVFDGSIHHTTLEIRQIAAVKVAEVVDGAPEALDTLKEIAEVIGTESGQEAGGILKRVADLEASKANKGEMSIAPVAGSPDRKTIRLRGGMSATVLTEHQDVSDKVDKIPGKGLSENDYTDEDKAKLAGLSPQTQADWSQADASAPDFIKNKPTIPEPVSIDPSFSPTSENPVQNKVVTKALHTGFTEWVFGGDGYEDGHAYTIVISPSEEEGYYDYMLYDNGTYVSLVTLSTESSLSVYFSTDIVATRHLVTPTKTSQLTNDGDGTNAFVKTNDPRLSDARTPTAHSHAMSDVTGLGAALAQKASMADLSYALVTPGEWGFSADGFSDVQKLDFVWYDHGDEDYRWDLFYNGTNTYYSYSIDPTTMEITGTLPTEVDSNQTAFTATRASLPGHLLDRAGNRVVVSGDTTLTLPAAVPGYIRDFLVRLEISGSTVPTITFAAPTGETIVYETDGDEFPVPDEAGTWSYSFTENCVAHKFAVSLKKVNEVAQGGS